MKRIAILIPAVLLWLASCTDTTLKTFTANVPVYMSYEALRADPEVTEGRQLEKPGKICFLEPYMFISEYREGIHVVDLTDPSDPQQLAFIEVPGNVDMAIRNGLLYADSYVDLVVIDISDPSSPALLNRLEDLFEYVIPEYDYEYPLDEIDEDKGVVTGFEVREITRKVTQTHYPWPVYYDYEMAYPMSESGVRSTGDGNTYGVGGSMARFLTYDDYLYLLESSYLLKTLLLPESGIPEVKNEQYLWGNVETLFISGEYMYVGTSNGVYIMSLEEPSVPIKISTYQHLTSCDPVVVSGNLAYATLRAGNACGGTQNLLEVIDISDKYNPKRMASFAMTEPYGLGIRDGILYICEGDNGLKVYDASDPYHITDRLLAQFRDIHAFDVIPLSGILFMTGDDGFYMYDTTDPEAISMLSHIPVPVPESIP
jgi:hypothetical protein